jgi:hypothetical protein
MKRLSVAMTMIGAAILWTTATASAEAQPSAAPTGGLPIMVSPTSSGMSRSMSPTPSCVRGPGGHMVCKTHPGGHHGGGHTASGKPATGHQTAG